MKKLNLLIIVLMLSYSLSAQLCCNFTSGTGIGGADPEPNTAFGIAIGDIDGDGDKDMVSHAAYEKTYVYKNNGSGQYLLSQTLNYSNSDDSWQYGLNLADIDGDGDLDLITTPQWSSAQMYVYKNNGSGTFSVWQTLSPYVSAYNKAVGDVDNDGDVDIVLVSTSGSGTPLTVYKNSGNGVFVLHNSFAGEGGRTVVLGDVDNDSDLDALVATQYYGIGIRLYKNDGSGNYTMDSQTLGNSQSTYSSVVVGDFNADGKLDFAAGSNGSEFTFFKNLGSGIFTQMQTYEWGSSVSYYMQMRVADIDGDGKKDLINSTYSGGVQVWRCLNNDFEFMPCYRSGLADYGHAMDIGDINNDGTIDIIGSCANDYLAYTFFNNGGTSGTLASASNSGPVCSGETITLFAQPTGATSYSWSGPNDYYGYGQNATINNVSDLSQGLYTVTVANANCVNFASTNVEVIPTPTVNMGNDTSVTMGSVIQFNPYVSGGSGNYTYQWQPANMVNNPNIINPSTVPITTSTLFILTVTDNSYGCIKIDSLFVTVTGSSLSASISSNPTSICYGNSTILTALGTGGSGNYTYSWASDPAGFSSTSQQISVSPTVTTTYYVTVFDGNDSATAMQTITVLDLPNITAWNDGPYCPYDTIQLHASDASSYNWTGPNGFTSNLQNPIVGVLPSGYYIYNVVVTGSNGCTNSADIIVTVNNQPVAQGVIQPDSLNIYDSTSIYLYGVNTGNIQSWQWVVENVTYNTQNAIHNFNQVGTYPITLIVTATNGCIDTANFNFIVYYYLNLEDLNSSNEFIKVYPNPSTSILNIVSESLIQKIEIYNLLGHKIAEKDVNNVRAVLFLNELSSGTYLLKAYQNDKTFYHKIIIKNN